MKKIISIFAAALCMVSCSDMLDIVPKGKTTLEKTLDLEMLLNQEYGFTMAAEDIGMICNESIGSMTSVPEVLAQPNTVAYAHMTYDETVDRAALTPTDGRYDNAYKYINYMNTILSKIGDAEGEESRKPSIIAEARIIRAYMHWIMVNIHARQYDEATAATDGGVPYVDDTDVSTQKTKQSVAEVYRRILEDCSDEVIAALPASNPNVERVDRAFGNAVRAKVLMQMKRYDEALPYALESLKLNGTIEDRSTVADTWDWALPQTYEGNLLYISQGVRICPTMETLSQETAALFEPGDYVIEYMGEDGWSYMFGEIFMGVPGCPMFFGWSTMGNPWGITSDRMYYTAAECLIRTGDIRRGLEMADRVRACRVEDYTPFTDICDEAGSLTEAEAMALMQPAKWIECIGSYENFFDSRRWNTEPAYRRTITRDLGEYGTFELAPDSPLWVLPFPANAVRYNSSLTQNY